MYIRASKSGPRTYVRLAESYRDENGQVRQRHLANWGVLKDLKRTANRCSRASIACSAGTKRRLVRRNLALNGHWAIATPWQGLWDALGLTPVLAQVLRMVFNRLCDPSSKLGALRWLEEASVPGIDPEAISHQHLLRAMDALEDNLAAVRKALAKQIKPLLDDELTLAFYDLTTIRVHGHSELEQELRHYGCNKELEGGIARQYLLAVVQSECGLSLDFAVFEGNTAEVKTLLPVLNETFAHYRLKRAIVVADRGLLI